MMDLELNSLPLKSYPEDSQDVQDATDLAAMGHAQALTRKFDTWSMLALAFCVLGLSIDSQCTEGERLTLYNRNIFYIRPRPQ